MKSPQPCNRLREKCGYVHDFIHNSSWRERPEVCASFREMWSRHGTQRHRTCSHGGAAQEGERPATRALWNWSGRVFVVCQPRLDPWRLMPPLWPVALNGRPMVQNPLPRILRRAKDFCFTGCCAACFMNRCADEDVCDCCGCVMATRIRSMISMLV